MSGVLTSFRLVLRYRRRAPHVATRPLSAATGCGRWILWQRYPAGAGSRVIAGRRSWPGSAVLFFSLSDWALGFLILAVVAGVTAAGVALGRYLRKHSEALRVPFGALQSALLG